MSATRRTTACVAGIAVIAVLVVALAALRIGNPRDARAGSISVEREVVDRDLGDSAELSAQASVTFPLRVSNNKRYLVDANGRPFLIHGDTSWSLIAQLRRGDAWHYLDDRRDRGFNTILVNLLEHKFSSNPPANAYGNEPFLVRGDFTTPNEAYFAHADAVIRQARKRGILVLLVPAYLGYGGGSEGWYQKMVANGSTKLRRYGEYLGKRYSNMKNILWVHGGDYNPPRMELVSAIVNGIRKFDTDGLHTMHCAPEFSAFECAGTQGWLDINNVYTYGAVVDDALPAYKRKPNMPYFLMESNYENEHNVTERRLRTQAHQANLSGAAGQIFGNNPIWHFDGPGLDPVPITWKQALSGTGSKSMMQLRKLFDNTAWERLRPDSNGAFLVSGQGGGLDRAVAAYSEKHSLGLVYVPTSRVITLDLRKLTEPKVKARWFDPANGKYRNIAGSPFTTDRKKAFRSPGNNSSNSGDWVLVLKPV